MITGLALTAVPLFPKAGAGPDGSLRRSRLLAVCGGLPDVEDPGGGSAVQGDAVLVVVPGLTEGVLLAGAASPAVGDATVLDGGRSGLDWLDD